MEGYMNKEWLTEQIYGKHDTQYMQVHFLNLLHLICINRFIWKGLPKHIDVDFIEKELIAQGELAFINDKIFGFQVCYCAGDYINMYGRPTKYLCWTANNQICDYYNAEDIVIIRNNKLSLSSYDFIRRYAQTLGETQEAKDVNRNALKTPVLIAVEEEQKLTMDKVYEEFTGNKPVIMTTKAISSDSIQVFKTDAPNLLNDLQNDKIATLNECLTFMGINTTPFKKAEVKEAEVNAYTDMVNICLSIFLNTRVQSIEQINDKWGNELEEEVTLELAEYCKKPFEPEEPKETGKEVTPNE